MEPNIERDRFAAGQRYYATSADCSIYECEGSLVAFLATMITFLAILAVSVVNMAISLKKDFMTKNEHLTSCVFFL